MPNSIFGKLRSNVRSLESLSGEVGHFAVTLKNKNDEKETVVNIFLTDKIKSFAQKNLKKGVIATVFFEYREHRWIDSKTNEERKELKKFATFIKPKQNALVH